MEAKKEQKLYIVPGILLTVIFFSVLFYMNRVNGQDVKFTNLNYGEDHEQTLDIYTPKVQDKKLPVMIYAHGGGWAGGDKENVGEKPAFFVNKGYVFVSVNYRMYPKANYNEMADDIASAVKWIYQNKDQYHIDGTRINLMGHSSGGHLVMLIGTNRKYLTSADLPPHLIRTIVNLEGPVDLPEFFNRLPNYKKVFGNNKRVWSDASPITYAAEKNLPAMFFVTRQKNSVSPFIQETLKAGNTAEWFEAKTLSHSGVTQMLGADKGNDEAKKMSSAIVEFINEYN